MQLTFSDKLIKFVTSYCCLPLALILTPFAKLYWAWTLTNFFSNNNKINNNNSYYNKHTREKLHNKKVQAIIDQVKTWNSNGRKTKLCTGRSPWKTFTIHSMPKHGNSTRFTQIELDLNDLVHIDVRAKTCKVEPGVMMGKLTSTLLPLGWTIPVVPELDTLSIGGLVCGAGLETSSHKYGLFADSCISYDVVLPSRKLVTCSKEENSDLFYAIPMSYGTIGFVTAVELPIIPASKYVKLRYVRLNSCTEALNALEDKGNETMYDFVEGIMYGLNDIVIIYGNMVNTVEHSKLNLINRWFKPWFYKHVESIPSGTIEYIPLRDYYHRHSRGFFWETATPIPYGNNLVFRWLFGWIFPFNFQIIKFLIPQYVLDIYYVKNHVVQDFVVPMAHAKACLDFLHGLVQVYPIWLCPAKSIKSPGMAGLGRGGDSHEYFIDIGVYGDTPKVQDYEPRETTRTMEAFVTKHQGYQALYADSYLTKDEFKVMFDTAHYYKVRKQVGAEAAFPDVYDKVSAVARQIK